jgi:hypothetical protein
MFLEPKDANRRCFHQNMVQVLLAIGDFNNGSKWIYSKIGG